MAKVLKKMVLMVVEKRDCTLVMVLERLEPYTRWFWVRLLVPLQCERRDD